MCTEYNPQEVSWRIKIIKNKQTKKAPTEISFFLPCCHSVCWELWGKGTTQNPRQKKQEEDRHHPKNSQSPVGINETLFVFPVLFVYSSVQCLSDTFSPPPGWSRTIWKSILENALAFIRKRPQTHIAISWEDLCCAAGLGALYQCFTLQRFHECQRKTL